MAKTKILENRELISTCAQCGAKMRFRRIEMKVGKKKERVGYTYCNTCSPKPDSENG